MIISLGSSCMNVYMAAFLIYSETIFSEMLMSMIIIFGMQMIYMYHTDDLISENSVSKLQEQIYGILFHRLLKTHNQFTYLRKIWGITWLREKDIVKGLVNPLSSVETCTRQWKKSASALAMACRIFGAKQLSEQMLAFLSVGPSDFGSRYENCHCRKWI